VDERISLVEDFNNKGYIIGFQQWYCGRNRHW